MTEVATTTREHLAALQAQIETQALDWQRDKLFAPILANIEQALAAELEQHGFCPFPQEPAPREFHDIDGLSCVIRTGVRRLWQHPDIAVPFFANVLLLACFDECSFGFMVARVHLCDMQMPSTGMSASRPSGVFGATNHYQRLVLRTECEPTDLASFRAHILKGWKSLTLEAARPLLMQTLAVLESAVTP
jgi:hypothetical protein